jgi:DNA primase
MGAPEGFYELASAEGRGALSLAPARKYLLGRGLVDEGVWRQAKVGACVAGRYKDRIVVPVLSPDNVWQGYVTRDWTGLAVSPYLYPPRMDRANLLYNHTALNEQTERPVMVVEGVLDALALWPDAVALLGKPSEPQVLALADCPRPVAIVLDGDAWEEGDALAMRLGLEGQRAGSVRLPPKKDPDEVDKAWLAEEVRRCLT